MPTTHRTRRGKISYISLEPERYGQERGRERFHMTFRDDGRRTLSAVCEIDDAPSVLRHVVMTYEADWRPSEALVRMDVDGRYLGSGWAEITPTAATLEGRNARHGRVSNRVDRADPVRFLGTDPIVSDAWHMSNYDLSKGPGEQFTDGVLTSPDNRGATGPSLWPLRSGMRFVGEERIEVAAGAFNALHFQFIFMPGQMLEHHAPYDIWVTADGDYVALRSGGGHRRYELVELVDGW